MSRSIPVLVALLSLAAACEAAPPSTPAPEAVASSGPESALRALCPEVTREPVRGDVWHYTFTLRVGDGPNAVLKLHRVVRERAPWQPRSTHSAVMAMHGDFATFVTNFAPTLGTPPSAAPGLAPWLAERGVDVWGLDRRFTQAPAGPADVSDFATMGLAQELDDLGAALTLARGVRLVTSGSGDRMTLLGFSRGGQLAYAFASLDASRPPWQRHVKGLVPLDVYAALSPADEDLRLMYCDFAAFERELVATGEIDSTNTFQIRIGSLALSAPDAQTRFQGLFPGYTNLEVLRSFAGQTYFFFPAQPLYHLAGPVLDADFPVGLRFSTDADVAAWFAGAPEHSSMLEAADTDGLLCNEPPLAADVPLSRIRVPLFLIAAAGGYGERAVYTTTQVSSTDVSTLVVRRLPVAQEAEDFGHGDLLLAADAEALAWEPLLSWLRAHR